MLQRPQTAQAGPQLVSTFAEAKGFATGFASAIADAKAQLDNLLDGLERKKAAKIPTFEVDTYLIQQHLQEIANNYNLTDVQILQQQGYLKQQENAEGHSTAAQIWMKKELSRISSELSRKTMQDSIDNAKETAELSGKTGEALTRQEIAEDEKLLATHTVGGQAELDLKKRIAQEQARLNGEENQGAIISGRSAEKIGDEVAQVYERTALRHIQTDEATNNFLLGMGEETLDQFKAQALKPEEDRYKAQLTGLQRREAANKGNAVALAKDLAEEQGLQQDHEDRVLGIKQQYAQKAKQIQQTELQEFIQREQSELSIAEAALEAQFKAGVLSYQRRHDLEEQLTNFIAFEVLLRWDDEHAGLVAGTKDYEEAMKQCVPPSSRGSRRRYPR